MIRDVVSELNFYLVEHPRDHGAFLGPPWEYLRYHCSTLANVYSPVFWTYRSEETEMTSKTTRVSTQHQDTWTGEDLVDRWKVGQYVTLTHGNGQTHEVSKDHSTGEARMCRKLPERRPDRLWTIVDGPASDKSRRCAACERLISQ